MIIGKVWIIIPQEIWSDHQKGKMVKIMVLTEKAQFLSFDLKHGLMVWDLLSRIQIHHLELMAWLNVSQDQLIDSQNSVNKWKVNWYSEKSNFDFLVKTKCQRSQFIKKSRFYFEKLKFPNLEIFLSVENFIFFTTLSQFFTSDTKIFNRRISG